MEERSLQALDYLISCGREPHAFLQRAKKVRRNRLGGLRSGEVRDALALARRHAIRSAAVAYSTAGETRYVPKLMKQFEVSRSTVMRAIGAPKVCHEPNSDFQPTAPCHRKKPN
jgi:hypothetical protein